MAYDCVCVCVCCHLLIWQISLHNCTSGFEVNVLGFIIICHTFFFFFFSPAHWISLGFLVRLSHFSLSFVVVVAIMQWVNLCVTAIASSLRKFLSFSRAHCVVCVHNWKYEQYHVVNAAAAAALNAKSIFVGMWWLLSVRLAAKCDSIPTAHRHSWSELIYVLWSPLFFVCMIINHSQPPL